MFLGYNTNGFAHHRLTDCLHILADLGYDGVALTLDYHALDPFAATFAAQLAEVRTILRERGLRCVIETGARFLLDPRRKHRPTLLSATEADRQRRRDFLVAAIEIAAELRADAVSFWSGTADDDVAPELLFDRLAAECGWLCDRAEAHGQRLAFEPEPGMFIDTMTQFALLHERVAHRCFGLTLDVGHLAVTDELPSEPHCRRWRDCLWNVHIEDMRHGVHDHLPFGTGDLDFAEIIGGLDAADYTGGLYVELSRHSHDAVATATRSAAFLRGRLDVSQSGCG